MMSSSVVNMKEYKMKGYLFAILLVAVIGSPIFGQGIQYTAPVCAGTSTRFNYIYVSQCTPYWNIYPGSGNGVKTDTDPTYYSSRLIRWDYPTTSAKVEAICTSNPNISSTTGYFTVYATTAPSVSISLTGSSSVCPTDGISLQATGTDGGDNPTYTWLIDGQPVQTTSSTLFSYSVQSLSAGSHQASVTLNNSNGCSKANYPTVTSPNPVSFTVQPAITYSVTMDPTVAVCQGTAPSFKAEVTGSSTLDYSKLSYTWYVNGSSRSDNTTVPVPPPPGVYQPTGTIHNGDQVYCVVSSSQGCATSPQQSGTVNAIITTPVTPSLSASIIPAGTTFCSGQTITFGASLPGTSYSWTCGSTTGTGSTFSMTVASNTSDVGKYKPGDVVSVTVRGLQGCLTTTSASASTSTTSIGFNPSISGGTSFCSNHPPTLTATQPAGLTPSSYQWYVNSSPINGASGATYQVVAQNAAVTNSYSVQANFSGCSALSTTPFSVAETPLPQGTLSLSPLEICLGKSLTVSGNGIGVPSYSCSSNSGQTWDIFSNSYAGQNSFVHVPTATGKYRYMVQYSNSCGQSAQVYQDLTVDMPPDPVGINGPSNIYPGKSYDYNVSSTLNNDSYQWSVSGGNVLAGQGTSQVSVNFGWGGGILTVVSSNNKCGNSNPRVITVVEIKMNYVREEAIQIDHVTSVEQINALDRTGRTSTTNYFDGLGRSNQNLMWQSSPARNDIVVPVVYDDFGREYRKYLPGVSTDGTGFYRPDILNVSGNYTVNTYTNATKIASDPAPYAQSTFEPSPLNRVVKQGAAGNLWQPDSGPNGTTDKTVKHQYKANAASEVMSFIYDPTTGLVSVPSFYVAGQLHANVTTDEHLNDVIEYIDKLGRTVCKKVQYKMDTNGNKLYASTYYIYDDLGHLVVVLPPEASAKFAPSQQ